MSTSASERNTHESAPTPLNVKRGQYIQEIGYDDDVDQELREALEAALEEELADEDVDDVFDAIIMCGAATTRTSRTRSWMPRRPWPTAGCCGC